MLRTRQAATQCAGAFVFEIMKGGRGVAEQIIFRWPGKTSTVSNSSSVRSSAGVMFEYQEVGCRESLERLGFADQDAVAKAKGDGLESFERERDSRTGRVVRAEDRAGSRNVADQEPEPGNSHGRRDGLFGETSRRARSAFASHAAAVVAASVIRASVGEPGLLIRAAYLDM